VVEPSETTPVGSAAGSARRRLRRRGSAGATASGCDDARWHEIVSLWLIKRRARASVRIRTLLRPGAWFTSVAVVVYGLSELAKTENWPHATTWNPGTFWTVLLIASGLIGVAGYFLVTVGYARALRRSTQQVEFGAICRDVAGLVAKETTIPYDKVGVHVWTVRGLRGMRYLDRRAQFLPQRRPQSSITWCKGKGAMGICWASDKPILADVETLETRGGSASEFCALARSERFGLSWEEFCATKHYRAILAMPLRLGPPGARRVAGVISVDLQVDGKAEELNTLLMTQQFSYVLSVCEDVLERG